MKITLNAEDRNFHKILEVLELDLISQASVGCKRPTLPTWPLHSTMENAY